MIYVYHINHKNSFTVYTMVIYGKLVSIYKVWVLDLFFMGWFVYWSVKQNKNSSLKHKQQVKLWQGIRRTKFELFYTIYSY